MNRSYLIYFVSIVYTLFLVPVKAQYLPPSQITFTRQDTLRGSITPERAWWDLVYYHLDIVVKPSDSTINGTNTVTYRVVNPGILMQIDLQEPMKLTGAFQNNRALNYTREGNVYWIELAEKQEQGKHYSVRLAYEGKPKVSVRPPWSGGITWKKDTNGLHSHTVLLMLLVPLHARAMVQVYGGHAKTICTMNQTVC